MKTKQISDLKEIGPGPSPDSDPTRKPGWKSCPHCQARFDRHEIWPFFVLTQGNTMRCLSCTRDSYLVPVRDVPYWLVFLLGLSSAVMVLVIFTVLLPVLTMTETHFTISFGMILLGAIVGIWSWRAILKAYNWQNGHFTTDDMKQSILDFGR